MEQFRIRACRLDKATTDGSGLVLVLTETSVTLTERSSVYISVLIWTFLGIVYIPTASLRNVQKLMYLVLTVFDL